MSRFTSVRAARRTVVVIAVAGAVLAGLVVAGCGSSSASNTSSTSGTSTGSSSPGVAAAAAAVKAVTGQVASYPNVPKVTGNVASLKGKTVWYVPIGEAVPIVAAFGSSMQSALARAGIKTHICDGAFLPTTIASCLDQAVTQGASAVVTAYIDYKQVPTAINNVVSHNIPLLVAGESDDAPASEPKTLGFYDNTGVTDQLGRLAIDTAIADSDGKAQILFIGASDSPSLDAANAGDAAEAKAKCPSCAFHALTYYTASIQKVPSEISAALIRYPNTTYIVDQEDTSLADVVQGVQSAGFTNKVKITAVDGSLAPLQSIASGTLVTNDVGVSAYYVGWGFADGIIRLMLGEKPIAYGGGIRDFTKQNVAGLTLTPAAYATNAWYGPASFEQSYLAAWGVK